MPVDDKENLARFLSSESKRGHVVKNAHPIVVSYKAFTPDVGTEDISVSRLPLIGTDACKELGCKRYPEKFIGLAVSSAFVFRNHFAGITEAPTDDNPGHANIHAGFTREKGQPLLPEQKEIIVNFIQEVLTYEDRDCGATTWLGPLIPPFAD